MSDCICGAITKSNNCSFFVITETSKSFEEDYDDESDTTTIESTSLDGDDDELPF